MTTSEAQCGKLYQSVRGAFPLYRCDLNSGHDGDHQCILANFSWRAADGYWNVR